MRPERVPVTLEGVPFIAFGALLALVFAELGWSVWAVIALLVTAFVLYFFRDPERIVPVDPCLVVSPADGKVIEIVEGNEHALQEGPVWRISIFMDLFNCHVNRAPITGKVLKISYRPGRFFSADKKKALIQNEQSAMLMESESGQKLTVVQVAGLVARRIVCRADVGDKLTRGERYGMIRFGSRLDVYISKRAEIKVKQGQKVRAGESVLAVLPCKEELPVTEMGDDV